MQPKELFDTAPSETKSLALKTEWGEGKQIINPYINLLYVIAVENDVVIQFNSHKIDIKLTKGKHIAQPFLEAMRTFTVDCVREDAEKGFSIKVSTLKGKDWVEI